MVHRQRPSFDADSRPTNNCLFTSPSPSLPNRQPDSHTVIALTREDGTPAGNPLTSASHIEDDYRFHDAFHLARAAVLRWSPVSRFHLGCKSRSHPGIDEAEDGGRAIAIEEGISALVFSY